MEMVKVTSVVLFIIVVSCGDPTSPEGSWGTSPEDGSIGQGWDTTPTSDSPLLDENGRPIVVLEEREIYAPVQNAHNPAPEQLDWIRYFRYRLKTKNDRRVKPDVVLLFTPGLTCGANVYYFIGHELLKKAWLERGAWFELLVVERRPNVLEDTRGMEHAEQLRETEIAKDYYFKGAAIEGQVFSGFLEDEDVPYLSEFGLQLALDDLYQVLLAEVPDPSERKRKVFVGGHSQAGTTTGYFAGWDFDGDPLTLDDAGFRNAAGYIALDCRVDVEGNGEASLADSLSLGLDFGKLREAAYSRLLKNMRNGKAMVLMPFEENTLSLEIFLIMELLAMEADFAPHEESSFFGDIPLSSGTRFFLQLLHSKNLSHFLGLGPEITDFRYTKEALFGVMLDNNFMPFEGVKTALGFLDGGSIVEKSFPYPEAISKIPLVDSLFGRMMDADGLFIANDSGSFFKPKPLYTWRHFDEIGTQLDDQLRSPDGRVLFTTVAEEMSYLHDYTKLFYKGTTNFLEWYYAVRFLVDLLAAKEPFGPNFGLNYYHGAHTDDLPRLTLLGGNGTGRPGKTDHLGKNELHILEGYNHIDLLIAAVHRPDIRQNEVFGPIIDFTLRTVGDK